MSRPFKKVEFAGGGGDDGCPSQNAIIDITMLGRLSGGTVDLTWLIKGTSETLTFNFDDDAAAAKLVMEGHSKIAVGEVNVTGGPFPNSTMRFEFVMGLKDTDIALPTAQWGGSTGGLGAAMICAYAQRGH